MSCCGSLFVNLGGGGGGGTVNTGVLQIAGGVALDSTLRFVEDQNGNDSILKLSTAGIQIGTGTITQNGILTVQGAGGNIASFRNNSNIQVFEFDNNGGFTAGAYIAPGSGVRIYAISSGVLQIVDSAYSDFNLLYFGSATTNYPAFKFTNTPANISFRDATDTNYIGFVCGYQSSKTIEVIQVSGAMGLGFFNTPAINQPTTSITAATYANVSGTEIKDADTFDGYTVGQVVKALRDLGLLA